MLRRQRNQLEALLRLSDYGAAALVALGVLTFRADLEGWDPIPLLALTIVATLAFPTAMAALRLYESQRPEPLWRLAARLGGAAAFVAVALAATAFATGRPDQSETALLIAFAQLVVLAGERLAIHGVLRGLRRRGRNFRRLVVVGTGPRARRFLEEVAEHPGWGFQVVALVDEGDVAYSADLRDRTIWKLVDFPALTRTEPIDEVVVAVPRSLLMAVLPLVEECGRLGIPVSVRSDLFRDVLPNVRQSRYGPLPVLRFGAVDHRGVALAAKRALDIVGALVGLLLASPVLAVAYLAIRAGGPGPVLFRQTRLGLHGRPFEFLKLRSMVVGAEALQRDLVEWNEMEEGPVFKMHDDPRITRVGAILRRWSVDELPQFWNVLRGDMSLVGPRPPLPTEVDQYQSRDRRRLSVRPGITCLWQIGGRNRIQFTEWVELDLHYIDQWSLWLDLWILLRTPLAVLRRDGAS